MDGAHRLCRRKREWLLGEAAARRPIDAAAPYRGASAAFFVLEHAAVSPALVYAEGAKGGGRWPDLPAQDAA